MLTDAQRHALQIVNNGMRAYLDAENAGWAIDQAPNHFVRAAFNVYVQNGRISLPAQRDISIALNQLEFVV